MYRIDRPLEMSGTDAAYRTCLIKVYGTCPVPATVSILSRPTTAVPKFTSGAVLGDRLYPTVQTGTIPGRHSFSDDGFLLVQAGTQL
jgi:hypothetical protein